jgi:hypothetical protein
MNAAAATRESRTRRLRAALSETGRGARSRERVLATSFFAVPTPIVGPAVAFPDPRVPHRAPESSPRTSGEPK